MLISTTAQKKIAALRGRYRICAGGTSASKTFSIIPILIDYALKNERAEISIVSESIPHLKRGAIRDFLKIMDWIGLLNPNSWSISSHIYRFDNGSFIEFFSADQPDKLRGARRDVLFVNEANNITWESFYQLSIRTKRFCFIDFNPTHEFWVHTELGSDADATRVTLTYKDNEALEQTIVAEIEKAREKAVTSTYWLNWWKIYGLGELGVMDGIIFTNWKTIDTIPPEARLVGIGLDFGFNDPTAAVEVYKYNDQRILNEIIYRTGMLNSDIAKALPRNVTIYADSAEPKSISELQRAGLRVIGVTKGADSVRYGIDVMLQQNYLVTKESTNLIKELRGYVWDKDKNGVLLNVPAGTDHILDSVRYAEMETVGLRRDYGQYHIR